MHMIKMLDPITPGEILKEEFMEPYKLSANKLSREIDVPANRISEIIAARRAITADTALRLGTFFRTSPEFWMNLQARYDLQVATKEHGGAIRDRVRPIPAVRADSKPAR